ncbi:MAG TPA: TerB family tellurite resistance protein [Thermoanaerobaculia bacterium]|nr:TerB family tellurite resistance protein [Thermoanaerobaculia bacterium]
MPIERLFKRLSAAFGAEKPETASIPDNAISLATAAVLLEIAHADESFSDHERGQLVEFLRTEFQLSEQLVSELLELADRTRKDSIDHWSLTNLIRKSSSQDQRLDIVKTMWRIVYSDGLLSAHEDHLVRKLGELLGLERHVVINAKLAVTAEGSGAG